ncbi:TonB-dependent receptor [Virgifigura deserti]|uniref:TonB-dependent receptor n=1 Tax=Virgifigura deserti TaxID=2268457 RepID=UPI003CCBF488
MGWKGLAGRSAARTETNRQAWTTLLPGLAAATLTWGAAAQPAFAEEDTDRQGRSLKGPMTLAQAPSDGEAGETITLDPVVVSATRTETPASELTRSVTVVTREEIEEQSQIDRNLSSILGKTVPGLSPSTQSLSTFGQTLRGREFLTLIDGVPQSTPLRSASRDLNTIDPSAIERIEVVRGGTAAYGFGATGGLINIVTRRPEDGAVNVFSEAGLRLSTEHPGDSLEWNTTHSLSGRQGQIDYLISGAFVDRQSFFDADGDRIPPDPLGVQGGLADTEEWNLLGKLGAESDDGQQRVELTANHFRILQDTDYTFGTGDPDNGVKTPAVKGSFNAEDPGTKNTLVNLTYDNADVWDSAVQLQAYYGDLTARFAKFPGFAQTEILSEKIGSRATVDTPLELGSVPLTLTWGLDYLHDETVQEGIDGPTVVPEMEQDAFAGFLEVEVPVGDWAALRSGVRREHIRLDVADVVNRNGIAVEGGDLRFNETLFNASAIVFLTDQVELFGGFSQGFSVADIGRAIRDGTATRAEDLESDAQKVDNYEIGVRGNFSGVSASLAGFYSESENGTTFDPDLNIVKQPERIWGVEATLEAAPHDQWLVGSTATWLEGEIDLDDDGSFEEDLPSTRVPPIKLTGYVEYSPFDWWTNRLQALYSGSRNPDSTQFGGRDVDGYVLFDFYSSIDAGPGDLIIGVENLFNEDYFPIVSQAAAASYSFTKGPGRTVSLTYSIKW